MGVPVSLDNAAVVDVLPGGKTTTGAGAWFAKKSPHASFQATVTGTGVVTATVTVEVSNGPDASPVALETVAGTITLTGTTSSSDGLVTENASWKFVRLKVTAISGTGATVTGLMGH